MLVKRNSPVSCDLHDVADHIKQYNKAFNKKHCIKIIANNVPLTVCFTQNFFETYNLCLLQLQLQSTAIVTPTNHFNLP